MPRPEFPSPFDPARLLVFLLLAVLPIVAAGCSADDDATADNVGSETSSTADQETADGQPDTDGVESDATDQNGSDDQDGAGDQDETTIGPDQGFEAGPDILVWAHDIEPPDLHLDDPLNGLVVTSWIREGLLESLFGVDQNLEYYPELLAREPTVTAADGADVTIEYQLRDGLTWSDGVPLTANDVAYTHEILIEGCTIEADGSVVDGIDDGCVYLAADRSGIDLVTGFEVISDTRFTVTMAAFYPDWRSMYRQIYAAHAFGQDAASVNRNLRTMSSPSGPLPASGPLVFERWDRGVGISLTRNDRYHGSSSPDATSAGPASIGGVRIQFLPTAEAIIDVITAGSAHIVMTTARPEFEALAASDGFEVTTTAGETYEHWGFNLLNRHLAKPAVRQAIALAIDKQALAEEVFSPLFGPESRNLTTGNAYWMPSQAPYVDHQANLIGATADQAIAVLESAGYTRVGGGVFRHPVDGPLVLRAGTTGGNTLREREQEVLQQQLAEVGIEIEIDNVSGGSYFRERPFAPEALAASASRGAEGDPDLWDITQFARLGGPWPGGQSGAFRAGVTSNPYGFNNPEFDTLASECDATVDDGERADCYNELDRFVTTLDRGEDGLFIIPLVQRPMFNGHLVSAIEVAGVAPDTLGGGPLVNVVDYVRR